MMDDTATPAGHHSHTAHHGHHHNVEKGSMSTSESASSAGGLTFHMSTDSGALLFTWWRPWSAGSYALSLVAIFGLAWAAGTLTTRVQRGFGWPLRSATEALDVQDASSDSPLNAGVGSPRTQPVRLSWTSTTTSITLHAAAIALNFACMLLVMTMNVGVFAAVVLGLAVQRAHDQGNRGAYASVALSGSGADLCH
mmetsp:Transcript_40008/g.105751  ORF Transcript_40008/g.105751 Transcript_40008/m.105751 type:complete len:196 (+) Transcript_40008:3-590(+)